MSRGHGRFRALLLVRLMREVRALGDNLICEAPPIQRLSKFLEQYGAAPSEELCGATEARPATDPQVEHALDDGVELDHHEHACFICTCWQNHGVKRWMLLKEALGSSSSFGPRRYWVQGTHDCSCVCLIKVILRPDMRAARG